MARPRPRNDSTSDGGTPPPAPPPLSDPHEIEFLAVRQGREWTEGEVDRAIRDYRDLARDADADAGKRFWRRGDKLTEFYNGFPERAKGQPGFVPLCKEVFGLKKNAVYELLRARAATNSIDEAGEIGRKKLRLGVQLNEALGIEGFAALRKVDLRWSDEGDTCRFPQGTVEQLESALALLKANGKAKPSRRLLAEVAHANEALREAQKQDEVLASAGVRFVPGDGEPVLNASHLTAAQYRALAKFMNAWLRDR